MMIYNISDFIYFFKTLDTSCEDLTLITTEGKVYDWETNKALLLSILQTIDTEKCNKMEIKLNNTQDKPRIICYMLKSKKNQYLREV